MGGSNSTLQAAWNVRHAHWTRLCHIPFIMWCCEWNCNMVVDTQFHKFYCSRSFTRVEYFILMKDIARWLPWVLPGSTGRFHRDDFGLEPFCALALYNPDRGRGKICMIEQNQAKTKLSQNCNPYITIIWYGYISYERQSEWWNEQNQRTIIFKQKTGFFSYRYVVLPVKVKVAAGHSWGPAQACGSG